VIRTQIQLTEAQSRKIRETARQSGVSAAEIIRRSIDRYLEQEAIATPATEGRLSALKVVGLFRSGLHDVAARHDAYLDEAYMSRLDQ
jgi:hypothetical protein